MARARSKSDVALLRKRAYELRQIGLSCKVIGIRLGISTTYIGMLIKQYTLTLAAKDEINKP